MIIISLIGFMGCGKSSIGKELSRKIPCRLIDLDSYIETRYRKKIPEIFESCGEQAFRTYEKESLREILEDIREDTVISTGGGTVTVPECAALLKEKTLCIYLEASPDTLAANLENDFSSRPMLSHNVDRHDILTLRARISELMEQREKIYRSTAAAAVSIEGRTFSDVAGEIIGIALREKIR